MPQKSPSQSTRTHVNGRATVKDEKPLLSRDPVDQFGANRNLLVSAPSYKGLVVWQRAIDMVDAVYSLTREFPNTERFALSDQMRRAAVSVPSNIAEGYGRNSTGEFKQFLDVARGSNCELETQIIIAKRQRFGSANAVAQAESLNRQVGRLLHAYMKSVEHARA